MTLRYLKHHATSCAVTCNSFRDTYRHFFSPAHPSNAISLHIVQGIARTCLSRLLTLKRFRQKWKTFSFPPPLIRKKLFSISEYKKSNIFVSLSRQRCLLLCLVLLIAAHLAAVIHDLEKKKKLLILFIPLKRRFQTFHFHYQRYRKSISISFAVFDDDVWSMAECYELIFLGGEANLIENDLVTAHARLNWAEYNAMRWEGKQSWKCFAVVGDVDVNVG